MISWVFLFHFGWFFITYDLWSLVQSSVAIIGSAEHARFCESADISIIQQWFRLQIRATLYMKLDLGSFIDVLVVACLTCLYMSIL